MYYLYDIYKRPQTDKSDGLNIKYYSVFGIVR
jgi:hypothetical protein